MRISFWFFDAVILFHFFGQTIHEIVCDGGFFHNVHISRFLMGADQCTTGHAATTQLPALPLSSDGKRQQHL
jgi:hypothetical protein